MGCFVPDNQRTLHVLMDVTAEHVAHKDKRASFVGFKGYIDGFSRLNALRNVYTESLQTESVGDIGTAQLEYDLITFGYLDYRFLRRAFLLPEGNNIIGPDLSQYPAFLGMSGQSKFFGAGLYFFGL